jgi:hypothetical protein
MDQSYETKVKQSEWRGETRTAVYRTGQSVMKW